MRIIKVGDFVRVIDNHGAFNNHAVGEVLEVKYVGGRFVGFSFDEEASWDEDRFQVVPKETPAPVVVRTKEQVQADRRKELLDGVVANHTAGINVPHEWIEELFYSSR